MGDCATSELHPPATAISPATVSDTALSDDERGMGGIVEVAVGRRRADG